MKQRNKSKIRLRFNNYEYAIDPEL